MKCNNFVPYIWFILRFHILYDICRGLRLTWNWNHIIATNLTLRLFCRYSDYNIKLIKWHDFQVLSLVECFQYIFVTQQNAMYAENLHCDKLSAEAISRFTVWKIRLFGTTLQTRMKGSVWFFSLQETWHVSVWSHNL